MQVQHATLQAIARSLAKVLVHEGGFSPSERPRGATMKGVMQRVYDEYRRSLDIPRNRTS